MISKSLIKKLTLNKQTKTQQTKLKKLSKDLRSWLDQLDAQQVKALATNLLT